jgi:ABC-type uncharacterized transport system permease subunit
MQNYIYIYGAIFLYLCCSTLLFLRIKKTSNNAIASTKNQILLIGLGGLILHALALHNSLLDPNGINLGFFNALSLVTAFIVLFTLIATWRHPIEIICIILLPIAAATLLLDINNHTEHLLETNAPAELIFHILSSLVAYSLLALAALQAIILSIQNRLLHSHQPGVFTRLLPPLKSMETLLFEVILAGFIALTISLGSGLLFLENMFEQKLAHKTVLSILAWFVFLILLIGHWKLGWRGRVATRWTIGGFISLMLAYFGSKFVLEIVLN